MEPTSTPLSQTGPGHRRVLVIEDDEITSALVCHRLERDGFAVRLVSHGTEALSLLREGAADPAFDLVLLDVKLPGAGGFEILEELRTMEGWKVVPVVILTGMGREEDVVRGFALGADDYIQKPFSPTELMARVQRLLRMR